MKTSELLLVLFAVLFVALLGGLIVRANLSTKKATAQPKKHKGAKHAKRNRESWDLD